MRKVLPFVIIALFMGTVVFFFTSNGSRTVLPQVRKNSPQNQNENSPSAQQSFQVIAENLDTPWAIDFLPDGRIIFTERPGTVNIITVDTTLKRDAIAIDEVQEIGEGGLLGVAVHPDFETNHYIYFYYTYAATVGDNTLNRVVRYTFENDQATDRTVVVDAIPGASNHNGGRMKFGPDGMLYIATGDASVPSLAQDKNSLAGKILRVTDEGAAAPGNPFGTRIYSYGHRNPQGLAWDSQNRLWATEHGRSGFPSGLDELNLIKPGTNYGWPTIQGDETQTGMVAPVIHSGSDTWAPAGAAIIGTSVYFGGLRGASLYEAQLQNGSAQFDRAHFKGEYGRLREVVAGPDGFLYVSTSNNDGRGSPAETDDRIFRIDPTSL